MATTGNLPPSNTADPTTDYFNNFFNKSSSTTSDKNAALLAFFQEFTGSNDSGTTLAATFLYTAQSQGIDPMSLLDQIVKMSKEDLTAYLTLMLNLNRVNTSLLGIGNIPQTSKYIQRTILP